MTRLLLALLSIPLAAQSMLLPTDTPVDVRKMKIGESACVFPVHVTLERHVWVSGESTYRNAKESCIFTLVKKSDGWYIHTRGIPIKQQRCSDVELERLGWLMLGSAEKVLRP
jgi:hypothetical protein